MPARLSDLLNNRRTIDCDVFGTTIRVTYRPGYLTPRKQAQLTAAAKQAEETPAGTEEEAAAVSGAVQLFAEIVESWDLTDDNGAPMPITPQGLIDVPLSALVAITFQCGEDLAPKPRR